MVVEDTLNAYNEILYNFSWLGQLSSISNSMGFLL
jgi:hypothetical protein